MGTAIGMAYNPADTQESFTFRKLDKPPVVTVNRKAGRVSVGACEPVELKAM